jgi:5-methylcytosine-specific restriction endonuclease McrA
VSNFRPCPKPKKSKRIPSVIRVKGKAMEKLRRECFERDGYRCVVCGAWVIWERDLPRSGHMAHVIGRGRGGPDVIDNVLTKCAECHIGIEHSYGPSGVKPCPTKPVEL